MSLSENKPGAARAIRVGVAIRIAVLPDHPGVGTVELWAALAALERRIDRRVKAPRAGAAANDTAVAIEDLDRAIASLRTAIDRRRREDLAFLLAEIAASKMRSGAALDAPRETMRYYALAQKPGPTEW